MNRLLYWLGITLLMWLGLVACTPEQAAPVDLPLAADKPTFLFFYTDE